jgi:hypothetical protein
MSISNAKNLFASERFMLVRIEPRRIVDLVDEGSDIWSATFPYPISKVEINGVALTRVDTLSGDMQFTFNESTGALTIQFDEPETDWYCVVTYFLFYTGTRYRVVSQDPEDDTTPLREWQAKIVSYPPLGEAFTDILSGVFSIQDTSLDLINDDGEFSQYLSDEDSFKNAVVSVWLCVDTVENIKRVFQGLVTSIEMSKTRVAVRCANSFQVFNQTATMGRRNEDFEITAKTPDISQNDVGKIIPLFLGKDTYFKFKFTNDSTRVVEANEAICASYSTSKTTSTNRAWLLGDSPSPIQTQSFGTLDYVSGFTFGQRQAIRWSTFSNVNLGDTLKIQWDNGGLKTAYWFVTDMRQDGSGSTAANMRIGYKTNDVSASMNDSNFVQIYPQKSICVVITDGVNFYYPFHERDYTVTETDFPYGSPPLKRLSITFANNFEASISGLTTLDPDIHRVLFRITLPSLNHGQALKELVNRAGLPDDGGFNTGANASLVAPVQFQIPNIDEQQPNSYLKYCQDILKGTLGYLRINDNAQAQYLLADTPSGSETRNDVLILQGSMNVGIEYQDIATHITPYNPHNQDQLETSALTLSPALSQTSDRARYLHKVDNTNRIKHPFKFVDNILPRLMAVYSNRRATYTFKTATADIETKLGDDLTIDSNLVVGSGEVKVTEVQKSTSNLTIKATDLLGI